MDTAHDRPDAATAARALAEALLARADELASNDLATIATAMGDVRAAARPLVDALAARGWPADGLLGAVTWGLDDELDEFDDVDEDDQDDDLDVAIEDDEDDPDRPPADLDALGDLDPERDVADLDAELAALLGAAAEGDADEDDADEDDADDAAGDPQDDFTAPPGERLTYQARYDFVVTDPQALLDFVTDVAAERGDAWDRASIAEHGPLHVLSQLVGLAAIDLDGTGLVFAGGQDLVATIERTLWELDDEDRDGTYPPMP